MSTVVDTKYVISEFFSVLTAIWFKIEFFIVLVVERAFSIARLDQGVGIPVTKNDSHNKVFLVVVQVISFITKSLSRYGIST